MAIAQSLEAFLKQHAVDYELSTHPRSGFVQRIPPMAAHVPGDLTGKIGSSGRRGRFT